MIGVPVQDPVAGYAALPDVPVGGMLLNGRSSAGVEAVAARWPDCRRWLPCPC